MRFLHHAESCVMSHTCDHCECHVYSGIMRAIGIWHGARDNMIIIKNNVATVGNFTAKVSRDARETNWGINQYARFASNTAIAACAIARAYSKTLTRHGDIIRDGKDFLVCDGYLSLGD